MTAHTPGPWHHFKYAGADYGICRDNGTGRDIAIVRGEHEDGDARLIAAAPELLALAEAVERYIVSLPPAMLDIEAVPRACLLSDARAAIAKATTPTGD